jgi:galactose mutarotase-like enzyme
MRFDEGDASGWDECLPSVAACTVETGNGTAAILDHGDLWRTEWSKSWEQGTGQREQPAVCAILLRGECFSLPLALERTAGLKETEMGWALELNYTVTNSGACAVPWSWAAHPLFAAEAGDRIVLPDSIRSLLLEGSGGGRLGNGGARVDWPIAPIAGGGSRDLSLAEGPESGIGDKLFAGPLTVGEDWCALERPRAGVRIRMEFDAGRTPYLGLWICYGGWPDGEGAKQACVALEPSTAPVDSLAKSGSWSRELEPGESFSWPMKVLIELIQDGNQDA